jgi:hypothetical protein
VAPQADPVGLGAAYALAPLLLYERIAAAAAAAAAEAMAGEKTLQTEEAVFDRLPRLPPLSFLPALQWCGAAPPKVYSK